MIYSQALNLIKSAIPGAPGEWVQILVERSYRARELEAHAINPKGWDWFRRQGYARNDGGYKTGTVTMTQGSRTVTLAGGTFPATCAGWRIGATETSEEVYTVVTRVSTTEVTLDRAYEGETGGKSYSMYDPYFTLPRDLYAWDAITIERDGRALTYKPTSSIRGPWPRPLALGDGYTVSPAPPTTSGAYETGTLTVAATAVTATVSGGASVPDSAVGRHLQVADESVLYEIKSVETTSAFTLMRAYGGHNAGAGKSYKIDPPGAYQVEVTYPQENRCALKVDYFASPQEKINGSDLIEGPEVYASAIVDLATADVLLSSIDYDRMSQNLIDEVLSKAKAAERRGMSCLGSLMSSGAPVPQQEAALIDPRYDGGGGSWGALSWR